MRQWFDASHTELHRHILVPTIIKIQTYSQWKTIMTASVRYTESMWIIILAHFFWSFNPVQNSYLYSVFFSGSPSKCCIKAVWENEPYQTIANGAWCDDRYVYEKRILGNRRNQRLRSNQRNKRVHWNYVRKLGKGKQANSFSKYVWFT